MANDDAQCQEQTGLNEGWTVTLGDEYSPCPGDLLHAPIVVLTPFDKAGTEACLSFVRLQLLKLDPQGLIDWHWVRGSGVVKALTTVPMGAVRAMFNAEALKIKVAQLKDDEVLQRRAKALLKNHGVKEAELQAQLDQVREQECSLAA